MIFFSFFLSSYISVEAGLNNFTSLIYLDEWLIERRVDLDNKEIKCRASIPKDASWFGARVRLGPENELIKPIWISVKEEQLIDSKLIKVRKVLNDCRSGYLFLLDALLKE
tara:strand:+ start:86 stop:418 length:333 start_codon:yes stop_codon:yes gene_type:complete